MRNFIVFIFLFFGATSTFAQLQYGGAFSYGQSNVYHFDNAASINVVNTYDWTDAYGFELFVRKPLAESKFSVQSGVLFANYASMVGIPEGWDGIPGPQIWKESIQSIGVPLGVNYHICNWFALNLSLENIFVVQSTEIENYFKELNGYSLHSKFGFEFKLWQRLLIGTNATASVTPDYHIKNEDFNSHFCVVQGRIGFLIK